MHVLPMGPHALLVDEVADPAGWAAAFRERGVAGVVDVVPAARTVLIVAENESALANAREQIPDVAAAASSTHVADEVVIDVDYDGPDLREVAETIGASVEEVIELHSGAPYRVAFCGFAPGFAYLTGLPERLNLPRRSTPRTRVPAGSVAIASEFSAVYPTSSPGGWHLLGTTNGTLFDVDRDPPALLTPGTRVRFAPR